MKVRVLSYAGNDWEITSGHPIPSSRSGPAREKTCYRDALPYSRLKVGESFDVHPDADDLHDVERCQNRVSMGFCKYRKEQAAAGVAVDFTTRQIHTSNAAFVRCWRLV